MSAGRGGEIGGNRYGVSVDVVKYMNDRSINTFRPLSEKWHRFLGLDSFNTSKGQKHLNSTLLQGIDNKDNQKTLEQMYKRNRGSLDKAVKSHSLSTAPRRAVTPGLLSNTLHPTESQVQTAMRKALRLGDGDEVSYRSKAQRVAMQSILYNDQMTPLVVVLPTGGGKSLLFMAPACLENAGVTIVIVPFRALINKLVSTAKEAGVNSTEWHPGLTDPATLVFVSADRIIGSGFLSYAELLHSKGLLRRVFVDECHLTFTASDWRPKLVAVRYVRGLRVPLIMLTATLPPMLAFELEVSMACQTVTRYIRATTTRLRTRYVVETCRRGELEETTIGTCKRMQKHIGRNKGVIYCRSIDQCKDMAKELGCAYYHGGSIDNEDKLAVWMETGGLIVATSALGTGVDFPGIVFILHIDLPYGMIDYAQESGRAGRAGEEVDSIIIVEQGKVESMRQAGRIRGLDEEIMAEFVTTRECRRQVMSRYLDGKIVECGAGDVAQCDRCGEGLGALERLHEKNGKERETVEKTLDDLTDGCASC
ncbi:unnamed protein product [Aureobasidium pullulans]|nr:unnamed protein product [Aureobasidium pullulans]